MRVSLLPIVLWGCSQSGLDAPPTATFTVTTTLGDGEWCEYHTEEVAEGVEIALDFGELPERDNIDRIVLGHLPFGRPGLLAGQCGPFDWTEMLLPSEDDYTLSVPASQVGADGGSLVVTLRSADIEIASVTLVPSPNNDRTEVSFSP